MSMNIDGSTFGNLELYADLTDNTQDNEKLDALKNMILAAAPDATPEEVGKAIDDAIAQAKAENPDAPVNMEEIFETAVKQLNSDCSDEAIQNIISAWQDFTGVSSLSQDDISQILVSPYVFVACDETTSVATIHNTMAMLILMMIEIAGEESADQLLAGFAEKDTIMAIAREKKSELTTKAWVNFAFGMTAAAVQGLAAFASMVPAAKGNQGLAQAFSGLGQAISGMVNAGGQAWAGLIDADIALLDGESQVAGMNKETRDKLKAKAEEVIKTLMNLLMTIAQAKQGVLTKIQV